MRLISMERSGGTRDSLKRSKKSEEIGIPAETLGLSHILPYESWYDYPNLRARSPTEIERGLSWFEKIAAVYSSTRQFYRKSPIS